MKHSSNSLRLAITFALILIGLLNTPDGGRWTKASATGAHGNLPSGGGGVQDSFLNFQGDPAVARNKDKRLEAFSWRSDNALWHIWQTSPGGIWSNWHSLGSPPNTGFFRSAPVVGVNYDGRLEAFVDIIDGDLWHIWQWVPNGAWSNWQSLGHPPNVTLKGTPAVAMNYDDRLEAFMVGSDGAMWHIWQTIPGGAWSQWQTLGRPFFEGITSSPVVSVNYDNRMEVIAVAGSRRTPYAIKQGVPGGAWNNWISLGGEISGELAIGVNKDKSLEIFGCGTNRELWHTWQEPPGKWRTGWESLKGVCNFFVLRPAVGRNSDDTLEVFMRGTDEALWHTWQETPGRWRTAGWESLGLDWNMLGRPAVGVNHDGRLELIMLVRDNRQWHTWQRDGRWINQWFPL